MKNIQDMVSSGGNIIELPAGEFKGPLVITKPCTVKGNSTTIWNNDGSVIEIRSPGVKICNLRAETVGNNSDLYCINSYCSDTLFENVEISGTVKGVKNEELQWIIPRSISLGEFKSESVNTYTMEIYIPADAELYCDISGVKIAPHNLKKGRNIINIETEEIKNKIYIYGEILLKSGFIRRIYISGKSFDTAEIIKDKSLYIAENPVPEKNVETDFNHIKEYNSIPENVIIQNNKKNEPVMEKLYKSQRIYIDDIADDIIQVEFNCRQILNPMDIDPYIFLLDRDNRVADDNDFIFFSNPVSKNNEIKIIPSSRSPFSTVEVDLKNVPPYVEKISFVYSIYANNSRDNFSKVKDPFIALRSNGNIRYIFLAENIVVENTVVFIEMYRHNMSWKMNMLGSGYKNGLASLCESYGLKVGY